MFFPGRTSVGIRTRYARDWGTTPRTIPTDLTSPFSHPAIRVAIPKEESPGTFLRGPGEARHPNAIRPLVSTPATQATTPSLVAPGTFLKALARSVTHSTCAFIFAFSQSKIGTHRSDAGCWGGLPLPRHPKKTRPLLSFPATPGPTPITLRAG